MDVNVLIALLDSEHASHETAIDWFARQARAGWASCPITQNGCIRIMSNPGYPNPIPVQAVVQRLADACHHSIHEFWPDDVSLLDSSVVDPTRIHGPRQLTDTYLLALAVKRAGKLATFDSGIALAVVRKATKENLVIL